MDNTEHIDAWLDGSMTDQERQAFAQRLEQEAELRAEVAFQQNVRAAVILEERAAIRRILAETPRHSRATRAWWYASAAAVIALVAVVGVYRMQIATSENLYNAYYRTFPNLVAPTVRSAETPEPATVAFLAYDNGDFVLAEALFAGLGDDHPAYRFYHAMSLMEVGRFSDAVAILRALGPEFGGSSKGADSGADSTADVGAHVRADLTIARHWYLGLCYLQLGERALAAATLEAIANEDHILGEQARELLNKLPEAFSTSH